MNTIHARNVNEALPVALKLLASNGRPHASRNGPALRLPTPVSTVYLNPMERVLFDPERNANPFFHFFESLWILAGREDVQFLAHFNKRMRQYSDNGHTFHGAYGARLRGTRSGGGPKHTDQIESVVALLQREPTTRRAVLAIWDPEFDLNARSLDVPCNDTIALRTDEFDCLHMTVFNRSNDAVWGAYGANAVQFSMLLEYIAARTGLGVGTYTQVSNDLHVYEDNPFWLYYMNNVGADGTLMPVDCYADGTLVAMLADMHGLEALEDAYRPVDTYALWEDPASHAHLKEFFAWYDAATADAQQDARFITDMPAWRSDTFSNVVTPMWYAWAAYRRQDWGTAMTTANLIAAPDWRLACLLWLARAEMRAQEAA
jgi:hypothetical protein